MVLNFRIGVNPLIDAQESVTAEICAFARAYHSNYERDKIFDDYLAYDLMGRTQYEKIGRLIECDFEAKKCDTDREFRSSAIREKLNRYISPIPLSRIAYAERELRLFARERGGCQYVICGAGMDTFAFRNADPRIRIFEIDHPDTQRYKLERIAELAWNIPENVRYVAVDFAKDDMAGKLLGAGFDLAAPSFFSILGVTYYLTLSVFEETLNQIGTLSSAGSKLVFDFPDDTTFQRDAAERVRTLLHITAELGEPMRHGYSPGEVKDALERHGYLIDDHAVPEKIQKRFFEGRNDGQRAYENIHFILAKKGDAFLESYYLNI